jgi:hypothetical protein
MVPSESFTKKRRLYAQPPLIESMSLSTIPATKVQYARSIGIEPLLGITVLDGYFYDSTSRRSMGKHFIH